MPAPIGKVLLRAREERRRHIRSMAAYRIRETRTARRLGRPMIDLVCHACKVPFSRTKRYSGRAYYCPLYAGEAHYARMYAMAEVHRAIHCGVLMRADQKRCVDCDDWAMCWDHRDYSKPFYIEPVCLSCNCLRPPAYHGTPRFSDFDTSTEIGCSVAPLSAGRPLSELR